MVSFGIVMSAALIPGAPAATVSTCAPQHISGASGEYHVLFHGVAPDGKSIAVGWERGSGATAQRGAFLLDLAAFNKSPLPHLNNAPSFSPDGRYLVAANYVADRGLKTEIVELDRRTGAARTYASAPSGEWLASYARDGQSILFNSTRTGTSDVYRVHRGSGAIDRITADPRYEAHTSEIDGGRRILFHRQTAGDNYDLVIRDLDSGAERSIGATEAEEAYPAMSPDGRWIAFSAVASPGGQPNLYVMRRDGSGRRRLTHGAEKDAYATWSPDARHLYFVRFSTHGSAVYRLAMRGGDCMD
jgi:Tol biopolymer transport system component